MVSKSSKRRKEIIKSLEPVKIPDPPGIYKVYQDSIQMTNGVGAVIYTNPVYLFESKYLKLKSVSISGYIHYMYVRLYDNNGLEFVFYVPSSDTSGSATWTNFTYNFEVPLIFSGTINVDIGPGAAHYLTAYINFVGDNLNSI